MPPRRSRELGRERAWLAAHLAEEHGFVDMAHQFLTVLVNFHDGLHACIGVLRPENRLKEPFAAAAVLKEHNHRSWPGADH